MTEHEHKYKWGEWYDPTGEAAISSDFKRMGVCDCGEAIEEVKPRSEFTKKQLQSVVTNDDEDSAGLGAQQE